MRRTFDVDIDVSPDFKRDEFGVRAMIYRDDTERIMPHPSGVYLEPVPVDPVTGLCAFDYKYGDDKGFMKVDLLVNTAYANFESKEEVLTALTSEVDWKLFLDRRIVDKLPHIANHFDIVREVKPQSIEDLADILALIRPAKIWMLEDYLTNKKRVRINLYKRPAGDKVYFKKSHAISYAAMIVCCLHRITETEIMF